MNKNQGIIAFNLFIFLSGTCCSQKPLHCNSEENLPPFCQRSWQRPLSAPRQRKPLPSCPWQPSGTATWKPWRPRSGPSPPSTSFGRNRGNRRTSTRLPWWRRKLPGSETCWRACSRPRKFASSCQLGGSAGSKWKADSRNFHRTGESKYFVRLKSRFSQFSRTPTGSRTTFRSSLHREGWNRRSRLWWSWRGTGRQSRREAKREEETREWTELSSCWLVYFLNYTNINF